MSEHFILALASLSIIIVYAVLVFRNVDPLVATATCVGLGFVFNAATPIAIGDIMATALSSFLSLIGFIIMLGRGLGEVLSATKVSQTLVYKIIYGIGINTLWRVKVGIICSAMVIVGILGTLAGGLAILAPILRPIAGRVGLTRPALAVLLQASGEEALILGPFAPPVVAVLGVTKLSYVHLLMYAAIPIATVTILTAWFMANKLQQQYATEVFPVEDPLAAEFKPNRQQNLTALIFILAFVSCVIYGLILAAKTSFVIFVMIFLALVTGLVGGLSFKRICSLLIAGMQKNFHLFIIFILLDPFLKLIQLAGGFKALTQLFVPLILAGGKSTLAILIGITGAFGMPAASAAVIQMLHEMFAPAAMQLQLATTTFAFSLLIATRITNFAYPGANMFAAMGFADSENIKAMIKNGLTVTVVQVLFLIGYSLLWH